MKWVKVSVLASFLKVQTSKIVQILNSFGGFCIMGGSSLAVPLYSNEKREQFFFVADLPFGGHLFSN